MTDLNIISPLSLWPPFLPVPGEDDSDSGTGQIVYECFSANEWDIISPLNLSAPFGPVPGMAAVDSFQVHPWVMLGMNATVRVEYDLNADGTTLSEHGVAGPDWRPVDGWCAVPVGLARNQNSLVMAGFSGNVNVPTSEPEWKAMFGRPFPFDIRHRLVVLDPDRNSMPRYLYVTKPADNLYFQDVAWTVGLREHYNPRG